MNIIQLYEEKENQDCFEFLENKIREASQQMIERIYSEKVLDFLNRTASIVDEKGHKLVVRNGWSKERTIQTSSGNIKLKLPRVDDRKSPERLTHIRTSNPIESTFATVRLRHNSTKGNGTAKATVAMAFKLCQQAEKNWRRLKGFEKLDLVAKNIEFEIGVLKIAA